jgi:hypothetical protein
MLERRLLEEKEPQSEKDVRFLYLVLLKSWLSEFRILL